jgi:hypothetical protein
MTENENDRLKLLGALLCPNATYSIEDAMAQLKKISPEIYDEIIQMEDKFFMDRVQLEIDKANLDKLMEYATRTDLIPTDRELLLAELKLFTNYEDVEGVKATIKKLENIEKETTNDN